MSTANEAKLDIYNRFVTEWNNATLFTFDNEKFTPPSDDQIPWVRVSIQNTIGSQETLGAIGNRKYERKGIISIQVFTATNSGVTLADSLSLNAQNIFEGTRFNSIIANNSIIKEVGVSDGWYQQIVQIDFIYTETK